MKMSANRLCSFPILFFVWLLVAATAAAENTNNRLQLYMTDQAMLTLESQGASLRRLVEELRETCSVEIQGLEGVGQKEITFSGAGSVEMVVKDLLKTIGVFNYALEFKGEDLNLVRVFPFSDETPAVDPVPSSMDQPQDVIEAIRIVGLAGRGQAEQLDLLPGDIVLTYNGVRATNTREFIREVRQTRPEQSVEMLVLRDRLPHTVYLSGGFIGIRIRSEKIEQQELEKFLP